MLVEDAKREFEDQVAVSAPVSPTALEQALDTLGDELVRLKVLARRSGDDGMLNDLLLCAEDIRDELDALPRAAGVDDAWVVEGEG